MIVDIGARCDSHTGEVFPVRCYACAAEAAKEAHAAPGAGLTHCLVPGHEDYLLSRSCPTCAKCERDAA